MHRVMSCLLLLPFVMSILRPKKLHSSRHKTDVWLYPKSIKTKLHLSRSKKRFILINAHWIGEIYFRLERSCVDAFELFFEFASKESSMNRRSLGFSQENWNAGVGLTSGIGTSWHRVNICFAGSEKLNHLPRNVFRRNFFPDQKLHRKRRRRFFPRLSIRSKYLWQ